MYITCVSLKDSFLLPSTTRILLSPLRGFHVLLSLRPLTVLPVPCRIYASLRCQTLLKWQNTWIHSSQFAFCKGRSTTLLSYSRFLAGIQFDFAKCFDSIPYTVIWDTLQYHGCDTNLISLLRHLYTNTSSTRTSRGRKFPVYKKNINL